jgi:hypothetical protein
MRLTFGDVPERGHVIRGSLTRDCSATERHQSRGYMISIVHSAIADAAVLNSSLPRPF